MVMENPLWQPSTREAERRAMLWKHLRINKKIDGNVSLVRFAAIMSQIRSEGARSQDMPWAPRNLDAELAVFWILLLACAIKHHSYVQICVLEP